MVGTLVLSFYFYHSQAWRPLSSLCSRLSFRRPRCSSTWGSLFEGIPSFFPPCGVVTKVYLSEMSLAWAFFPMRVVGQTRFARDGFVKHFPLVALLAGLFYSNFSSYHLIWSSFLRVFGVFPDFDRNTTLKIISRQCSVLCVRVLFMCFRGFGLTNLLSADQQWLSFQMSLSVFLPPN